MKNTVDIAIDASGKAFDAITRIVEINIVNLRNEALPRRIEAASAAPVLTHHKLRHILINAASAGSFVDGSNLTTSPLQGGFNLQVQHPQS